MLFSNCCKVYIDFSQLNAPELVSRPCAVQQTKEALGLALGEEGSIAHTDMREERESHKPWTEGREGCVKRDFRDISLDK